MTDDGNPMGAVLDQLEALLTGGRPVPLTDQVRVSRRRLGAVRGELSSAASEAALSSNAGQALGQLEDALATARPIPLTPDVRLDRASALAQVELVQRLVDSNEDCL